jgi:sarcosine oxidase gamma subunit
VSALDFLSPDLADGRDGFEPRLRSPLEHGLGERGPALGIHDISLSTAKIEVRGDVERLSTEDGFNVTPERALVLAEYERGAELRAELEHEFDTVIDLTGALAGVRVERPDAERLLRRISELDLRQAPTIGAVAHIPAHVLPDERGFRLFFPQEYGDYFAEVLIDAAEGLE